MSGNDNTTAAPIERKSRLPALLIGLADGTVKNAQMLRAQTGWDALQCDKTIQNAVRLGYAERHDLGNRRSEYAITPLGRIKLAEIDPGHKHVDPALLPELALALVGQAAHGMHSDGLAKALHVSQMAVLSALAPLVEAGQLVTCKVQRPGMPDGLHYRLSAAGTARYDWKQQNSATWTNRMGDEAARMAEPAEEVPGVVVDFEPAPTADDDTADTEPVSAQLPPFPESAYAPGATPLETFGTPYLGELDIDAAHGGNVADFSCAMWSTGVLVINARGQRMTLKAEHTRQLLGYLDRRLGAA